MAFNLTATRLVLVMTDLAGDTYELYYRNPTNAERVAFSNSLYEKKGKKTVAKENVFAEQVAMGKKLCLGFSEGYFMDGDDFISSDKSKPYHREDWKDLIEAARPTDFQKIAIAALQPSAVGSESEQDDEDVAGDVGVDHAAEQPQAGSETPVEPESEAPLANSSEAS